MCVAVTFDSGKSVFGGGCSCTFHKHVVCCTIVVCGLEECFDVSKGFLAARAGSPVSKGGSNTPVSKTKICIVASMQNL
jgi:hypothetical protein